MGLSNLDYLLNRYLDEALSASERRELEKTLLESSEAREIFWAQSLLHGAIRDNYEQKASQSLMDFGSCQLPTNPPTSPGILTNVGDDKLSRGVEPSAKPSVSGPVRVPLHALDNGFPATAGYLSSGWPMAYLIASVVVGIGIAIASVTHVSDPGLVVQKTDSLPAPLSHALSVVGRVTSMIDCVWDTGDDAKNLKSPVSIGDRFNIRSGLVEITYGTGAKVLLQGPVTYSVDSAAGGYLAVGKLTACLEKHPVAALSLPLFAVRTPTAVVTDLGTEFGVDVSESGTTSTHVFRGIVKLQPVARDGRQARAIRLTAQDSAQVKKSAAGEWVAERSSSLDPAAFVRAEQVAVLLKNKKPNAFERWYAFSRKLRCDPSLLTYYDFQQRQGQPEVLPNVAANGDKSLDGFVREATWTDGRMPGKHALLFQNEGDYVQLHLPQTVDDLTLAAWVRVTILHDEMLNGIPLFNGLLMSENWDRAGQVHWQLDAKGRMCLGRYPKTGTEGALWLSSPVFDRTRLGRWTHMAMVFDRSTHVKFYVNGRQTDDVVNERRDRVPICIGASRIGSWNQQPRTFRGRIDELAVFGRVLSANEIQQMFEEGKPDDDRKIVTPSHRTPTK